MYDEVLHQPCPNGEYFDEFIGRCPDCDYEMYNRDIC